MRQTFNYTSSAAAYITILELLGKKVEISSREESKIFQLMGGVPGYSLSFNKFKNYAENNFNKNTDLGGYKGGLAVYCYNNLIDNINHFVVLLKRDGDYIYCFDPLSPVIKKNPISMIKEINEGDILNIDANINEIGMHIFQPIDFIIQTKGSKENQLYHELYSRGFSVSSINTDDLFFHKKGRNKDVLLNFISPSKIDRIFPFVSNLNINILRDLTELEDSLNFVNRPSTLILKNRFSFSDLEFSSVNGPCGAMISDALFGSSEMVISSESGRFKSLPGELLNEFGSLPFNNAEVYPVCPVSEEKRISAVVFQERVLFWITEEKGEVIYKSTNDITVSLNVFCKLNELSSRLSEEGINFYFVSLLGETIEHVEFGQFNFNPVLADNKKDDIYRFFK